MKNSITLKVQLRKKAEYRSACPRILLRASCRNVTAASTHHTQVVENLLHERLPIAALPNLDPLATVTYKQYAPAEAGGKRVVSDHDYGHPMLCNQVTQGVHYIQTGL